jgi:hypothetical protein
MFLNADGTEVILVDVSDDVHKMIDHYKQNENDNEE